MASSSSTTNSCVAIDSTVVGELSRGRDTADRLRRALRQTSAPPPPPAHVQGLVAQILDSFTHSISMLQGSGHKRRRPPCETWTKVTPAWPEDGYAWRKYGQKDILNTKHPRSYFRCTHKHDQGCQATKQVQKIQDDPPLFKATYHAHHSCNYSNHLMIDAAAPDSSIIWSFQAAKQESPSPSPSPTHVCGGGDYLVCSDPDSYSCSTTTSQLGIG